MKLNTRARYSLRLMMAIAKLSAKDKHVHLGEIAEHCHISRRYLDQLVSPLKNAQLVRSVPGRSGGYALAKDAADIRIGEIVEAAIGPIAVTECAASPDMCISSDYCNCRGLWALLNWKISQVLYEYSLADILEKGWDKKVRKQLSKMA
jgi:Rrf2 family protein